MDIQHKFLDLIDADTILVGRCFTQSGVRQRSGPRADTSGHSGALGLASRCFMTGLTEVELGLVVERSELVDGRTGLVHEIGGW